MVIFKKVAPIANFRDKAFHKRATSLKRAPPSSIRRDACQ
jgi:hypothetical protein